MPIQQAPWPDSTTTFVTGVSTFADRYRGFLLDQWGVLHDGARPYPGAQDCLARMRDLGKPVIILSNSGRSGAQNEEVLTGMGFPRAHYERVVSAGDDAREAIAAGIEPFYRDLGRRCLLLSRDGDRHLAGHLGLELVEQPEAADFVLLMGMDSQRQSLAGWRPLLERARACGLPMICGNPDLHRTRGDGSLEEAPGIVAQAYAALGGVVRYHGKPEPGIYRSCLRQLGLAPSDILCIGDSLAHDIAGARGAGLDSAFIAGGIHRGELAWPDSENVDPASCLALFKRHALYPDYALAHFHWSAG